MHPLVSDTPPCIGLNNYAAEIILSQKIFDYFLLNKNIHQETFKAFFVKSQYKVKCKTLYVRS